MPKLTGTEINNILKKERLIRKKTQPLLESGVDIKTVNGDSLLGGGDLVIVGGGTAPVYANVRRQASQTISAGPWVAIQFDTEGADSGTLFSLANPTYVEVPSNGIYSVSAYMPWKAVPGSGSRGMAITKNGGAGASTLVAAYDNNTGNTQGQTCSWIGPLLAGDKLYLYVITTSADEVRPSSENGACFLGVIGFAT